MRTFKTVKEQEVRQNTNRQKLIIMPKLNDYSGNMNKQWFVYYSIRDPKTGKMKRYREYKGFTGLTKKKKYAHGEKIIEELRAKLKNGWSPITGDETVVYSDNIEYNGIAYEYDKVRKNVKDIRYWANKFLEIRKKQIRKSTYAVYRWQLRVMNDYVKSAGLEGSHPEGFKKEDAIKYNEWLTEVRKVGNNTLNMYNMLSRSFWDFMIEKEVVKENVFEKIKKLKFTSKAPRIYNKETLDRLTKKIEETDPQLMVAVRFIYNCFIRPGELIKLKIKDIDFGRGTITVPAEVSKVKKTRVVDVPDYFMKYLKEGGYDKQPNEYYIIGNNNCPQEKMVGRNYLGDRFKLAKKAANINDEYILYAFKHTGMVDMKLNGIDVLDIRNQAGHKSLDQTAEYLQELMGLRSRKIREEGPRI